MDESSFSLFLDIGTEINVLSQKLYANELANTASHNSEYRGWHIEDGLFYIDYYEYRYTGWYNYGVTKHHLVSFSDLLRMKGE